MTSGYSNSGKFKKEICFVSLNAYPVLTRSDYSFAGGAEVQEVLLARELIERGASVSFITLDHNDGRETFVDGIRIIPAFKLDAGIPVLRFIHPRLTSVWKALSRADAEIYYERTASVSTAYVSRFCETHGRKSIHAVSHDREVVRPLKFLNIRDRGLYRYGLRRVDHVTVQSKYQRELLRKNFGRDGILMPNGIKIPGFVPEMKREGAVGWVATLRPWKRPERFIELARALPDVPFLMAGGPDPAFPELFDKCRREAESLPNLKFLGFVPFQDVENVFDRLVLFVNTSDLEGFPNTYLQSWVRGIPVVSMGVDPDGVIKTKRLGAVSETFRDMVAYTKLYYMNENLRVKAGERAWNHVRLNHDIMILADRFITTFESVRKSPSTDSLIVDSRELLG